MYMLRKYLIVLLCFSLTTYTLPVFASVVVDSNSKVASAQKVELTDNIMRHTIGAGNLDANMVDYKVGGTEAKAIVTNQSPLNVQYSLEVLAPSSNTVLEVLATGSLAAGASQIVKGKPTVTGTQNRKVRIRLFSQYFAGLYSQDISFASSSIDSDEDGIRDWSEKRYGLDPNDPTDAVLDADGDTLSNIDEINKYRTDPTKVDSDGDSINDNVELQFSLNPNNPADANLDPDNDFLTNAQEILVYKTDPRVANPGLAPDTDGDGILDIIETTLGLDPLDNTSKSLGLDDPVHKRVLHALNRVTFGPTSKEVDEMLTMGISEWIDDQLIPVTLDDGLDPAQTIRDNSYTAFNEAEKVGAIRAVHSIKHLQTRMAMFWDNHFNTEIFKTSTRSELYEEDLFFVNAFGNFRTLLGLSAKSDAMLRYLDLRNSTAAGPNENFAREVMELFTFGKTIDSGIYDGNDIVSLARILTGWSSDTSEGIMSRYGIFNGAGLQYRVVDTFTFKKGRHDAGEKTYLGQLFPAGAGVDEGERALDILAYHDATALNICTKLAQYFVSDYPTAVTINNCAETFKATATQSDQIAVVLRGLFNSVQFNDELNQRGKFKDNQEYLFSIARFVGWNAVGTLSAEGRIPNNVLGDRIEKMGQRQFAVAEPTGLSELAVTWANANNALHRFREGNEMIFSSEVKLQDYFTEKNITNSSDILAHTFMLLLGGHYNASHIKLGYLVLHPNNEPFVLKAYTSEQRLKNLVARIIQLPEFSTH